MSEMLTKRRCIIEGMSRHNRIRFDCVSWPCDGHECPSYIRSLRRRIDKPASITCTVSQSEPACDISLSMTSSSGRNSPSRPTTRGRTSAGAGSIKVPLRFRAGCVPATILPRHYHSGILAERRVDDIGKGTIGTENRARAFCGLPVSGLTAIQARREEEPCRLVNDERRRLKRPCKHPAGLRR